MDIDGSVKHLKIDSYLLQQRRSELAHAEHFLGEGVEHLFGDRRIFLDKLVQLHGLLPSQATDNEWSATTPIEFGVLEKK